MELCKNYRKFSKSRVHDSSRYRKLKEDRISLLRKSKRLDRANVERRKFKVDQSGQSSFSHPRSLAVLPMKFSALCGDVLSEQIEAIIYFRRILALDKNPPLEAVRRHGVFPKFVDLLLRYDSPKLQHEAAWCITNIACGDAESIQELLSYNALHNLLHLICHSPVGSIKEQALWAVSNLSNESEVCHLLSQDGPSMALILAQIGVEYLPNQYPFARHCQLNENPALSTMRHVTFVCSQVLRSCKEVDHGMARCILFAFADMLQSPDEEIIQDICLTLSYVCSVHDGYISLLLEFGIISRLAELFLGHVCQDLVVQTLCICMQRKDCVRAHRNVMAKVFLLLCSPQERSLPDLLVVFMKHMQEANARKEILQCILVIMAADHSDAAQGFLQESLFESLKKVVSSDTWEGKLHAGALLCELMQQPQSIDFVSQGFDSLTDLLTCTDAALLYRILMTLTALLQTRMHHLHPALLQGKAGSCKSMARLLAMHPNHSIASQAEQMHSALLLLEKQYPSPMEGELDGGNREHQERVAARAER